MSFNKSFSYVHIYLLTNKPFSWTLRRDNGISLLVDSFVPLFAELYQRHTGRSIHLCRFSIRRIHNHLNQVLICMVRKHQHIMQSYSNYRCNGSIRIIFLTRAILQSKYFSRSFLYVLVRIHFGMQVAVVRRCLVYKGMAEIYLLAFSFAGFLRTCVLCCK